MINYLLLENYLKESPFYFKKKRSVCIITSVLDSRTMIPRGGEEAAAAAEEIIPGGGVMRVELSTYSARARSRESLPHLAVRTRTTLGRDTFSLDDD